MALLSLLMVVAAPAAGQQDDNIHLTITGAEKTRFTGECVVTTRGREQSLALDGTVPLEHRLHGSAIACSITQLSRAGHLQVEVRKEGNISRSRTEGRNSTVNLHVR